MKRPVAFVLGIVGVSTFGLGTIFLLLAYFGSMMDGKPGHSDLVSVFGAGIVTIIGIVAVVILNKYPKAAATMFFVSVISYSLVFLIRVWPLVLFSAIPIGLYLAVGVLLIVNERNKKRYSRDQVQDSGC
ncbi:hypothetical protein NSQ26_14030 [Bacillus sp. FSL W7-1360]